MKKISCPNPEKKKKLKGIKKLLNMHLIQDVRSYRLVALTNILCKIFERMTNERLVLGKGEENR